MASLSTDGLGLLDHGVRLLGGMGFLHPIDARTRPLDLEKRRADLLHWHPEPANPNSIEQHRVM